MRVVAGELRGRRLMVPAGLDTRPTMSRVRESIFDILRTMDVVVDANVVDLFAGSGALGIEALSQGAAEATFVDSAPKAVEAIKTNLRTLGLHGTVVRDDVLSFVRRSARFDLALIDPPFAFDGWHDLLDSLQADYVVFESNRSIEVPDNWEIVKNRRYGDSFVVVARRAGHATEA